MNSQDRSAYGFTYSMFQTGPGVSADEVESNRSAIEVMILWDSDVVHVSHIPLHSSFYVGEESGGKEGCDYFIPSEMLGTRRVPIVVSNALGVALVILPRPQGYVDVPRNGRVSLVDLIASRRARPSEEIVGAYEYPLGAGVRARMELEGGKLAFEIGYVNAGKRIPVGLLATMEPEALLYTGLSFLLHIGLVVAFAFFMPHMHGDDGESLEGDRILMMQKLLDAAAAREQQTDHEIPQPMEAPADGNEGGTGAAAKSEAGSMGNPVAHDTGHKSGVAGPRDNPDPHLAKASAMEDAARFGLIGYLTAMAAGDPNAPTAPWGQETSLGQDVSARGNMFGDGIGDSPGTGGLDLTGAGAGGGGRSEYIGLGEFNFDQGAGPGAGQGIGIGRGPRSGSGHRPIPPHMRELSSSVNGRLGPEIIQRIVRQNFGRFRYCYENAMRSNPMLQGRVTVKFVVGRTGAVAMAADGGSDIPDQGVVQCVVRGFGNLSFPEPEGGVVTVVYPIMFTPGE